MTADVYKHLLRIFYNKPLVWTGFVSEVIRTLLIKLASGLLLAQIISSLDRGDLGLATQQLFWLFGISLVGISIGTVGALLAVYGEGHIYTKLSHDFYNKLTGKDIAFYHTHQSGSLTLAFRQYLDVLFQLLRLLRTEITRTLTTVLGPVVILFVLDWRLGVATLVLVAIQLSYIRWSSSMTNKYREYLHAVYHKLSVMVGDHITNIVALRASGEQKQVAEIVFKLAQQENRAYWFRSKVPILLDWPRSLMTMGGIAVIVLIELGSHLEHTKLIGLSVLTVTYLFQILYSFESLPSLLILHDNAVMKVYPMLKYWKADDETVRDPLSPQAFPSHRPQISFEHVAFSHMPGQAVFDDLTLHIKAGEHIGIVGQSGSGKSTLAGLLMRFQDVQSGTITIGGINIRELSQADLHRHIAYVAQEPLLFHGTIRENIGLFSENVSRRAIEKAARLAYAHDFIMKLPDGYDTLVGERGLKLSGGQKQRIAIARAILKNAPIILFDEATSALDSESEQILRQSMPEIIGGRTALIIAHRLSTVAWLDRIVVVQDGVIVETGTHQQLLEAKGVYFGLWQKQSLQQSLNMSAD